MSFLPKNQSIESTTNQKYWSKKGVSKALIVTAIAGSGLFAGIVNAKSIWANVNNSVNSKFTNETTLISSANNAGFYIEQGNSFFDSQQYEQAIASYTQAIALEPQSASAYYNRGNTYYNLQQYESAIADLTQAIAINPQYADAYYNRGNIYLNSQKPEEAIADHTQAIKFHPKYAQAYNNRGIAYVQIGQYQKAVEDLEIAAQLHAEQNNIADSQQARGVIQMIREEIARINTPAPTTTYQPSYDSPPTQLEICIDVVERTRQLGVFMICE
jgi:tetratricopeptide (TPR) repeat protein